MQVKHHLCNELFTTWFSREGRDSACLVFDLPNAFHHALHIAALRYRPAGWLADEWIDGQMDVWMEGRKDGSLDGGKEGELVGIWGNEDDEQDSLEPDRSL